MSEPLCVRETSQLPVAGADAVTTDSGWSPGASPPGCSEVEKGEQPWGRGPPPGELLTPGRREASKCVQIPSCLIAKQMWWGEAEALRTFAGRGEAPTAGWWHCREPAARCWRYYFGDIWQSHRAVFYFFNIHRWLAVTLVLSSLFVAQWFSFVALETLKKP